MSAVRLEDVRFAIRRLRRDLGTTLASVAALACAIGAASATWSLVSAVLLNPLPVEAPERLFQVERPVPAGFRAAATAHTYPVVESIRDSGTFDGIAAGGPSFGQVLEQGIVPQGRTIYFAAHDFFATLGVSAARGRTFTADDDRRGAPAVAVLSDRYWRSVFDADPNVLGRTVTLSGTPVTIVGILPRGFRGLHLSEAPDLYLPLNIAGDVDHILSRAGDPLTAAFPWIRLVGRLRPDQTAAGAVAQLNALDCMCERGLTHGEVGGLILTNVNTAAVSQFARTGAAQFATLLSITVGLLLLLGCLTVSMLLLVRTEDRRDELAVRLALGATRGRLAAGAAVEAALLCALGAVLAVPVMLWFTYGIRAFQLPGNIDIELLDLVFAPGAWLTMTGAAFMTTAVIALLANLGALAAAVRTPVQERALATPRVTRGAPRTVLVASQVAITLVLTTGAGLFTRSLIEALSLNPVVETDRIVTAAINLSQHGYTRERAAVFVDELRESLRVNSVIGAVSTTQPVGGMQAGTRLDVDGMPRELPSGLAYLAAEASYFSTIGLPVVSGRGFDRSDDSNSPRVAIVSASLGRLLGEGGSPLGRRIADWASFRQVAGGQAPTTVLTVIGVVPDLIMNVNETEPLVVYQPNTQIPPAADTGFVVRAAGDPNAAMRELIATARMLDPRVTPERLMTLDEQIEQQMNPQRFGVYVLGALGGIALLLTVLGTYVIAQSMVVRRRRELGIRAALGARTAQLHRLVMRDTARLVGIGLVAGIVLAIAGSRLIRSLLYQVEPLDPLVLTTVAGGIFGLALLVSLRPALEATRVDVTRALRDE